MEPFRIIIRNDFKMIPPLQAAAHAYGKLLGFSDLECFNIEVVSEELLSNVIRYDFMPGQLEDIEIEFRQTALGMQLKILSKCIPLDIDKIASFEKVAASEIIDQKTTGLGMLLVKNLVNKTHYVNHGREGQEITAEIYLSYPHASQDKDSTTTSGPENGIAELKYYIRRLQPEEAQIVSKLAYFAYQSTYVFDAIYYPDRVRKLNEKNELMSYVAVKNENNDIIGHCANVVDEHSNMYEIGIAFVHPGYRGHGCLNELMIYQLEECRKNNIDGAFAHAVTKHPYSQKSLIKNGLKESALMVSYLTPVEMTAIEGKQVRESLLFMYIPLNPAYNKTVFMPKHHRDMIERIYKHTEIEPEFIYDVPAKESKNAHTSLKVKTDAYLSSKIYISKYGRDAVHTVWHTLKLLCVDRVETIYLNLPSNSPETATLCSEFEKMGFFFSGIQPGFDDNDWLVLQYLNNQIYPYDTLAFATDFGKSLAEYVRSCDPNVKDM
jgi:anti-sigma regulatory factor (Ser/Thr protein kinase)/GNAT superfamily N-acetyltransferase